MEWIDISDTSRLPFSNGEWADVEYNVIGEPLALCWWSRSSEKVLVKGIDGALYFLHVLRAIYDTGLEITEFGYNNDCFTFDEVLKYMPIEP